MIFNVTGGGGAALNFKVVGGTTQPTNPTENTIWVNTSTTISSYVFAAAAPSNPTSGMVWISIGTASGAEFNALKKNGLQVYPISAKQYVNGAWASVTAKSYQSGAWVEWISFLYDRGEIGLGGTPTQIYKDTTKNATVTLNADYISINLLGNVVNRAGFPNAVDFSAYSTMKATVKAPSKWSNAVQFRFGVDSANHTSAAYKAQALNGYTAGTEYTITLDISAYNKTSKPWFELYNGTGQGEEKSLYVLKINLE